MPDDLTLEETRMMLDEFKEAGYIFLDGSTWKLTKAGEEEIGSDSVDCFNRVLEDWTSKVQNG